MSSSWSISSVWPFPLLLTNKDGKSRLECQAQAWGLETLLPALSLASQQEVELLRIARWRAFPMAHVLYFLHTRAEEDQRELFGKPADVRELLESSSETLWLRHEEWLLSLNPGPAGVAKVAIVTWSTSRTLWQSSPHRPMHTYFTSAHALGCIVSPGVFPSLTDRRRLLSERPLKAPTLHWTLSAKRGSIVTNVRSLHWSPVSCLWEIISSEACWEM